MRRFALAWLIGLVGSLAVAAPVPAGKSSGLPMEIPVPAKSVVILQQNDYTRLLINIQAMIKSSFGKDGDKLWVKLNELDKSSGSRGFQWKGITKGERLYFAITSFDFEADEPPFVASIPVDDVKVFRESIFPKETIESTEKLDGFEKIVTKDEGEFYWLEQKSRVYLCGSKEIAESLKKSYEPFKTKTLGDSLESFFASDISLFINIDAIREKYDEQIKQFRGLIPLIMQQGGAQLDKAQLDAAKTMLDIIFQLLDDGKGVTIGLSLKEKGVAVKLHSAFVPSSPSAKFTNGEKPSTLDRADKLPAGFAFYTASGFNAKTNLTLAKLYREFIPAESDEAGTKAVDEWMTMASQATRTATAVNYDRTGITAFEFADAGKAVTTWLNAMKSVGEGMKYQQIPIKGKPVVTENEQTFNGISFHRVKLSFDFEAYGNTQPEVAREASVASVKKLLPETVSVWVGGKSDMMIQVSGKDWDAAKTALEKTFNGKENLGSNAVAKATRQALPADVGSFALIDGVQLTNFINDYTKTMLSSLPGGLPFDADSFKLAKVTGETAFLGFSFTMTGPTASIDLFVPHRLIGIVYEAVKPMIDEK